MEENKIFYWKHFKVWIFGILISCPLAWIFGGLFIEKDLDWIMPILFAILFLPLVFHGIYGFKHGFCMSWRYGYIYRGNIAKLWNIFDLVLYIGIVLLVIIIGGKEFS